MKPNITQREIDSGKKIVSILSSSNPRLLPSQLKNDFKKYANFTPDINKYGLWFHTDFLKKIKTKQKFDKVFLLYNGLAASGKDSIYREMTSLLPEFMFKTVSATSRPIREDEVIDVDHYFYTKKQFKTALKNNDFFEYIKRGDTYYGLPKKSLEFAFNQSKPVIFSQLEMSAWSKIEEYIKSLKNQKILIIKLFITTDMNFHEYLTWLEKKRVNDDLESRINKTGWEIKKAPEKSDIIVTNRVRENIPTVTYSAKTIINQIIESANLVDFPKFLTPTDNLKPTNNTKEIINAHDSIE